ncbi:MAG: rod shape-determining protein MreC [Chloroflexi bacterium]|nr:rod shape-determining protein MreC [Chloroflexota bacterium]
MHPKRVIWVFLLLAILVAVIALPGEVRADFIEAPVMKALEPLQARLTRLASPLAGLVSYLNRISGLEAEKQRLEGEVAQLTSDVARLKETESENRRLRELVSYQSAHPEWNFLGAEIISRDPNNLVQSATLDKGSQSGVAEGMTVLAGGTLVGRISRVLETTSRVLFVSDASSSVNAMVQRSRALGVIKGRLGNRLLMDYLPQTDDIQMNDLIITSGLGGGFPKGLPLGRAVAIRGRDVEPFLQLEIEPLLDFRKLETVIIILNFTPLRQ